MSLAYQVENHGIISCTVAEEYEPEILIKGTSATLC